MGFVFEQVTPTKVDDGDMTNDNISAIAAGVSVHCAIRQGSAYCWGQNTNGQLGDGSTTQRNTPVKVADGAMTNTDISSIVPSARHTCAIKNSNDGTVYCWGQGGDGALGNGSRADSPTPITVESGAMTANDSITDIAAGGRFTCAIRTNAADNNVVYCWGDNFYGTLGHDGVTGDTRETRPVETRRLFPLSREVTITVTDANSDADDATLTVTAAAGNRTITGEVSACTEGDPSPVGGQSVALLDVSGAPVTSDGGDPVTALTGADGSFVFGSLEPVRYQVNVGTETKNANVTNTNETNLTFGGC